MKGLNGCPIPGKNGSTETIQVQYCMIMEIICQKAVGASEAIVELLCVSMADVVNQAGADWNALSCYVCHVELPCVSMVDVVAEARGSMAGLKVLYAACYHVELLMCLHGTSAVGSSSRVSSPRLSTRPSKGRVLCLLYSRNRELYIRMHFPLSTFSTL
jgi:hypothetical protein